MFNLFKFLFGGGRVVEEQPSQQVSPGPREFAGRRTPFIAVKEEDSPRLREVITTSRIPTNDQLERARDIAAGELRRLADSRGLHAAPVTTKDVYGDFNRLIPASKADRGDLRLPSVVDPTDIGAISAAMR